MKRILANVLVWALMLTPLCQRAQAAAETSSASIISTALSQLDCEEGARGYSTYGDWYGLPYGHWCDMFVSWCAERAGIPKSIFPRSAGCTTHVRLFSKVAEYQLSAARGGGYVPQPGDVIFFYDYVKYPKANVVGHTGIVLCVENGHVFTIEGNTLTNRLDYSYVEEVLPLADDALEPNDYVAVKHYPLDYPQIHGYAVPRYSRREALSHNGWVDLGKYESLRTDFDTLASEGIMPGTSSYTFSPRYGMARGEFLALVMGLYGLAGWDEATIPFIDVSEDSSFFGAVMTARSAGIVNGTGSNRFNPDLYISGPEAQAIISRTLAYVGQEDQHFSFSQGDFSYLLTPYTIRADLASALYELRCKMLKPAVPQERLSLNGEALDWPMLRVNSSIYVPLDTLQETFPGLAVADPPEDTHLPIPLYNASRILLTTAALQSGDRSAEVSAFYCEGRQYVMLHPTMNLLGVKLSWPANSSLIELTCEFPEIPEDLPAASDESLEPAA